MIATIVFDSTEDFFLLLIVMSVGTSIGRLLAEGILYWWKNR